LLRRAASVSAELVATSSGSDGDGLIVAEATAFGAGEVEGVGEGSVAASDFAAAGDDCGCGDVVFVSAAVLTETCVCTQPVRVVAVITKRTEAENVMGKNTLPLIDMADNRPFGRRRDRQHFVSMAEE